MDGLTKLYSRKDLEEFINNKVINLDIYSSFVIFDIDTLIAINDIHGYLIADKYLTDLGLNLKNYFKEPDLCFRFNGEEFIVFISDESNIENDILLKKTQEILDNSIDRNCVIDVEYSNNKFYSISACIAKNVSLKNYNEVNLMVDNAIIAIQTKKEKLEKRKYKKQNVLVII